MPAIRRIIELEQQLTELTTQRDELASRLAGVTAERDGLARRLSTWLRGGGPDRSEEEQGEAPRGRRDRR